MQSVADTVMDEAVKAKPKLQQSQDVGNARNVGHLLRKAAGTNYRWPKREARWATIGRTIEAKASKYFGGQIIPLPLRTLDVRYGAKEVDVYPCWALVLHQSSLSLLPHCSSLVYSVPLNTVGCNFLDFTEACNKERNIHLTGYFILFGPHRSLVKSVYMALIELWFGC